MELIYEVFYENEYGSIVGVAKIGKDIVFSDEDYKEIAELLDEEGYYDSLLDELELWEEFYIQNNYTPAFWQQAIENLKKCKTHTVWYKNTDQGIRECDKSEAGSITYTLIDLS